MSLQVKYSSQDEIPEGFEDHYVEQDGAFVLDAEGYETKDAVQGLKTALQKERDQRKQFESRVSEFESKLNKIPDDLDFEEFDPDTFREFLEHREKQLDPDELKQELRDKYQQKYESQIEEKDSEIQRLNQALRTKIVDEGLTQALVNANVKKDFMPAVKAMLRDEITLKEDDGEFKAVAGKFDDPLDQYIEEWAQSEAGKAFVKAAENNGGGAGGGSGGGGPTSYEGKKWSEMTLEEKKAKAKAAGGKQRK